MLIFIPADKCQSPLAVNTFLKQTERTTEIYNHSKCREELITVGYPILTDTSATQPYI